MLTHAKALLQNRKGFTEHEAYTHLRAASRRSRKRMGDVARNIKVGDANRKDGNEGA